MTIVMDRRRAFMVLGALLPAGMAWAQAVETPVQIVTALYKASAGKNGKHEGPSAIDDSGITVIASAAKQSRGER